jgi:hypothetical protein
MNEWKRGVSVALTCGALVLVSTLHSPAQYKKEPGVVFLDQGWSDEDRLRYYYTSQGSAAIPYDIFVNLETTDGGELFRSDKNVARYGLVPHPADPKNNPDGLAIGLTKTVMTEGPWKGEWVGLGCAACHNGQLEYKGTKIRISGGNANTFDPLAFVAGVDDALTATATDPQKLDRLAERLGQKGSADKEALRMRLEQSRAVIHRYRTRTALTPVAYGPGRMDALGLIHNQVLSNVIGVPENWRSAVAPVKPSFVWNMPQSAWAQWVPALNDPVLRNAGEVMGVFARMDLTSKTPADGLFDSTLDLKGQLISEELLRRLAPPKWPEEILGKIDREKAAKGKQLFAMNCSGCHSTWPHRWSEPKKEGKQFIENAVVPIDVIGTDAAVLGSWRFVELTRPTSMAGALSDYQMPPFTGVAVVPAPVLFAVAQRGVFEKAMGKLNLSEEERLAAHGYQPFYPEPLDPPPSLSAYKANPAEGMWASPPYLHNGSVPNLYELLSPAKERSKTFFLGRDFDPVKVGVDTSGASGKLLFDTSLFGNSNIGHSFENGSGPGVIGPLLTEEERSALIEYMKSIPDEPAQISPFGGPEHPVSAWKDATFFNVRNRGTYNGAPE